MRNYIKIIICFLTINAYSQSKDTIYFLVNTKDTLIKKQVATKQNSYEGYLIIDEKRIKKLNKTPLVEGKVWVPESDDDFHTFGPSFSFNRSKDTIVTKSYINSLKIIKNRIEFLRIDKLLFNYYIFFIEPQSCGDKFVIREVYPVFYE